MEAGAVLFDILVVLAAAKVAAEIAERVGVPPVVAEIVAGVLVGPSALGLVQPSETLHVLGEMGVILLLLGVGLEMDLRGLRAVGRASLLVALAGVVLPMLSGWAAGRALGEPGDTALFVGAALGATSVGITARVFADLRSLGTVEARTVLGAAVADDVLGLVILTVVVRIVTDGSVSAGTVAEVVGVAVLFLVLATLVGLRVGPPAFAWLARSARGAGTLVAAALVFTLAFAELADRAELAPIVGAFVAGLCLAGTPAAERVERDLRPVGHLFVPVFFLAIGIDIDLAALADGRVLAVAGVLTVVAVLGKLASAVGMVGAPGDRLTVGLGMIPRGEVGLIFASIGLQTGVLDDDLYAALLVVVLATTLATPPLLRWRVGRRSRPAAPAPPVAFTPPAGGSWLVVRDGAVDLVADPPDGALLPVALEAARLAARLPPSRALLDRLARPGALVWDPSATAALVDLLRDGDDRSWRFLEATGLLERALPEVAEAVGRRRSDPSDLDPAAPLRFPVLDALLATVADDREAAAAWDALGHPGRVLLAALVLDASGDHPPAAVARRLADRLGLGIRAAADVALLVEESGSLRVAARRVDALDERNVLALAAHLGRPERVRALLLLSLAVGPLESWERARLDALVDAVLGVLGHPELAGPDASDVVAARRSAAMAAAGAGTLAAERLRHAPPAYVLAQEPASAARQAALVEPPPGRDRVRVAVTDAPHGRWLVDVGARDRPGLLAAVTGVLERHGLDVVDATVATWPDGVALQAFVVRAGAAPSAERLAEALAAAVRAPSPGADPVGAEVAFDDSLPWHTRCDVTADDAPGLLHAVAVALATAGCDVHAARVRTVDGRVHDRFDVTDRAGRRLDEAGRSRVRDALATGTPPAGRRTRPRAQSGRRTLTISTAKARRGPS